MFIFASHIFRHTNSDVKEARSLLSIIRDIRNFRVCSEEHVHCLISRLGNVCVSLFISKTGRTKEKWMRLEKCAEKHLSINLTFVGTVYHLVMYM